MKYKCQQHNNIKYCRKCNIELNDSNWWPSRKNHGDCLCDSCYKEHKRQYYKTNKNKLREVYKKYYHAHKKEQNNSRLKYHYGITLDEYNVLLKKQNRCCAICGSKNFGKNQYGKTNGHIDHNHLNGKIRGILCNNCNRAIGWLKVDTKGTNILYSAIKYIKETK